MQGAYVVGSALCLVLGCGRTGGTSAEVSGGDSAAAAPSDAAVEVQKRADAPTDASAAASARSTPPAGTVPATGPFTAGNNHATITGKPFPTLEGAPDPVAGLRKTIPVKLATKPLITHPMTNPRDFALGRGFLLRDRKDDDRARWFVLRVENKTSSPRCSVRILFAQFRDTSDKPVGGGHNLSVHGSMGESELQHSGQHIGLPGVGALLGDDCLAAGEAGYVVLDMASEDDCGAKHPCSPGAADVASVELELAADEVQPLLGPATHVVPTSYDVAADRVSLTVTSRGPNPTALMNAQGLALDASGDPLFVLTFPVDKKTRIFPGGTLRTSDVPKYRGTAATRMSAWVLFVEAVAP